MFGLILRLEHGYRETPYLYYLQALRNVLRHSTDVLAWLFVILKIAFLYRCSRYFEVSITFFFFVIDNNTSRPNKYKTIFHNKRLSSLMNATNKGDRLLQRTIKTTCFIVCYQYYEGLLRVLGTTYLYAGDELDLRYDMWVYSAKYCHFTSNFNKNTREHQGKSFDISFLRSFYLFIHRDPSIHVSTPWHWLPLGIPTVAETVVPTRAHLDWTL